MRAERPDAHDSEVAAATYLGGGMRPRARRAFERHLLGCQDCWREVSLGREGRHLAESARQVAPAELRERLRTVISAQASASADPGSGSSSSRRFQFRSAAPSRRRPAGRRAWAALAATAALVIGAGLIGFVGHPGSSKQPAPIDASVADFRAHRLPGTLMPSAQAPDLTQVHLRPLGAASGSVAQTQVTAFSYRDAAGRDVLVYLSQEPFPTAVGAQHLAGPDGPWIATADGVTVLCARSPHALLVLGRDRQLVLDTARALGIA